MAGRARQKTWPHRGSAVSLFKRAKLPSHNYVPSKTLGAFITSQAAGPTLLGSCFPNRHSL